MYVEDAPGEVFWDDQQGEEPGEAEQIGIGFRAGIEDGL